MFLQLLNWVDGKVPTQQLGKQMARLCRLATVCFAVRVFWVLLPQYGYVHPDEFFQGCEVVAGDMFGFNVTRPWEFTSSAPLRSIVPIYLTSGLPLLITKWFLWTFNYQISSYWLLITPRLFIAALSVCVDWCVCIVCTHLNLPAQTAGFLQGTSFVMIAFCCRSFSNTTELFLFSILLSLVCKTIDSRSYKKSVRKDYKCIHWMPPMNQFYLLWFIGIVLMIGVFNRITFIFFSFVPVVYLITDGLNLPLLSKRSIGSCAVVGLSGILMLIPIVFIDSVYYKSLDMSTITWESLRELKLSNFTLTPLNFVLYNTKSDNLAAHGLHPWWLHCAVFLPVITGPLLGFIVVACLRGNPFLSFTFIVPVVLLSLFPHQELRFLIPLLPVVICLGSSALGPISQPMSRLKQLFLWLWVIYNLLLSVFWGHFHQAGVVPALMKVSNHLDEAGCSSETNICIRSTGNVSLIFHNTYMPPQSLLLNKKDRRGFEVDVYDLAGSPDMELLDFVRTLNGTLYVISPVSMNAFEQVREIRKITLLYSIFPHLSFDRAFPHDPMESLLTSLWRRLSLFVYKVS